MSIEDIINSAKNQLVASNLLTVNIPTLINQNSITRNDMLIYSSIETLSSGTDTTGKELNQEKMLWALPAPSDIIDLHSANYEGVGFAEAKVMQNAMKNGSVASGILEGIKSGGQFFIDRFIRDTNKGSNTLLDVKALAGQGNIYNQYSTATRTGINPNIEMAYRGPNLRQIQFQFRITPFSVKDADNLYTFINAMRKYIYPITDNTIWKMGYPAKFAISVNTLSGTGSNWSGKRLFSLGHGIRTYSDAGNNNAGAEKIGCVLTDMQVSYGELGTYAGHFDGSPSIANINLTFQENLVSTRESISDEYNKTI